MSRLYDSDGYLAILQELDMLNELPITVDSEDLELLLKPQIDDQESFNSPKEKKEIECVCPACGHSFIKQS